MTARRRLLAAAAAALALVGVVLIVVGVLPDPRDALPVAGTRKVERTLKPEAEATGTPAAKPRPARVSAAVRRRAAALPVEQQVAQLFLVGFSGRELTAGFFEQLQLRGWGAVLLTDDNAADAASLGALAGEAKVVARNASRVEPLLVAEADVAALAADPGEPLPGGGSEADQVRLNATGAGQRFAAAQLDLALGPVIDLRGPTSRDGFSDDPEEVVDLATATLDGFRRGGVLLAPKHFPGQGGATQDPLSGPAGVGLDRATLESRDLVPFRELADDVRAFVVSNAAYAAYDGVTPAGLEPAIARDLLRREIGFSGVAISSDLAGAAAATGGTVGAAAVEALRAGIDLLAVHDPAEVPGAYRAVLDAVRGGKVPRARVTEALHRVLTLKAGAG